MSEHTPTPWFVSGIRFRMNGGEWQSINRYDESKKQDENIALVGYDPRNGLGQADAAFIVKAVNNHDALVKALQITRIMIRESMVEDAVIDANTMEPLGKMIDRVLGPVGSPRE